MKKIGLLIALVLISTAGFSQKKKTAKKAAPKSSSTVLAKSANVSAELNKDKFYVFTNASRKDTITIKTYATPTTPLECKITPFTAKGTSLYCITWTEKNVPDTQLKNEEATSIFNEIWDLATKTQILANNQTTTKITEIVFLDKNKTVSETREKLRKEGFEFTLTKEGDVILKNKSQENKLTYSPVDKKYTDPVKKK